METKYSKTEFEGFTHRFIVQFESDRFESDQPYRSNLNVYSNSDSYQNLEDFLNKNKSEKVLSFKVIHRTSKEQDEITSKFIEETLNDI